MSRCTVNKTLYIYIYIYIYIYNIYCFMRHPWLRERASVLRLLVIIVLWEVLSFVL